MLDRDTRHLLEQNADSTEADDGWTTSYLDVLTLLLTLFVLLLALAPTGSRDAPADSVSVASLENVPLPGYGLKPLNAGLAPRIEQLDIPGVSVTQGQSGVTLRIDDSLLFDSGQAALTAQGQGVIDHLGALLTDFDGEISVEGHTDDVPISTARFPSNWELSSARAIAVVRFLERQGLEASRLRAVGYADTRPMASNASIDGRRANRRVELLLRQAP